MNILDYVNNAKDVRKIEFNYKGSDIKCYIKELSQAEAEDLGIGSIRLMPIYRKQEKGIPLNDDESKLMIAYQSKQVFEVLCDKEGNKLFATHKEMIQKIKGEFFKALCKEILEDPIEKAEKNL